MSYYQQHVFVCINQKASGGKCCQDAGADEIAQYFKQRLKSLQLWGQGRFRVTKAKCLGRCSVGPVLVLYPDEVWYTYNSKDDIDEIIQKHLLGGKVVEHLCISDTQ